MKTVSSRVLVLLALMVGTNAFGSTFSFPNFGALAEGVQGVRLLPGQREFVFSMYGAPGELEPLRQLVRVMREQKLGNGFDPGPGTSPHVKPIFDYLATVELRQKFCYPRGG